MKVKKKVPKNTAKTNYKIQKITSLEISYYVKVLSIALFFTLGIGAIVASVYLQKANNYSETSASIAPNQIVVYAMGATNTTVSPHLTLKLKRQDSVSETIYDTKRIEARTGYQQYVYNVPTGVYKGDILYFDYDNDTSDTDLTKGTCNGSRDLFIQKIIIGDRTINLDTRVVGTETIDPTLDTQARADSAAKRVVYDRANNECGALYFVGSNKMDFATYRDFDTVSGRKERGLMYYGDTLWANGPFFRGQMHWDGTIRVNVDWTTGEGSSIGLPTPVLTPTPATNPTGTNGGTKQIDISQIDWDVVYFQNNYANTQTLKSISADIYKDAPKKVRGINVSGWPFGPRKYDFSIRWTANLSLDGKYKFTGTVNDGLRIWVDGVQVYNNWVGRASSIAVSSNDFVAVGTKFVEIEYMQKLEQSYLDLRLANLNATAGGVTPTPTLVPTTIPTPVPTIPVVGSCPVTSSFLYGFANQNAIPKVLTQGEFNDPMSTHADMNPFVVRGYLLHPKSDNRIKYVLYGGPTDAGAYQLNTLFKDKRLPEIIANYKVYDWNWVSGTRNGFMAAFGVMDVPATGFKVIPGEEILAPYRGNGAPDYVKIIYADANRINVHYGSEDTVASGYTVQLNNLCTDPNLVRIYRNARKNGIELPRLKFYDHLGWARSDSNEIMVIARDSGMFLDPRSIKDWWQGFTNQTSRIVSSDIDQTYK